MIRYRERNPLTKEPKEPQSQFSLKDAEVPIKDSEVPIKDSEVPIKDLEKILVFLYDSASLERRISPEKKFLQKIYKKILTNKKISEPNFAERISLMAWRLCIDEHEKIFPKSQEENLKTFDEFKKLFLSTPGGIQRYNFFANKCAETLKENLTGEDLQNFLRKYLDDSDTL